MARAFPLSDNSEPATDPHPSEWQALRGELVALLDQVEGRYAPPERADPAYEGLAQRVRNLRDQVVGPETAVRRREALRTVKRAVDRFSERDEPALPAAEPDALATAIAEIRSRQMSASAGAPARRPSEGPEFRELMALVGGLSSRLERLEGELKSQRASNGSVSEVASQVEQLTHVVELLAGAVGETGQVKRLEVQIAGLAQMIGEAPKVDLSAINTRLDDVSATVGKLAELQAQQMEREIVREDRDVIRAEKDGDGVLAPAMYAIEKSVRNVYDRIDAIEKNVALSSNDFERLIAEMAGFTQAMRDRDAAPDTLADKVDALATRIGGLDTANGDVAGLKQDITALRSAVMSGMEPRFSRIESQIEALSEQMVQPRTEQAPAQIENQLKLLMARMDETGAQLSGLAKLYDRDDGPKNAPDFEALATMVAEKTSTAFAKQAPSATPNEAGIAAFEKRMTALLNTAGKDTAERLSRLETALTERHERAAARLEIATARPGEPAPSPAKPAEERSQLDAMLAALSEPKAATMARSDAMPANPGNDAPLIDPGFKDSAPPRPTPRKLHPGLEAEAPIPVIAGKPAFDPSSIERPPRPQSSLASADVDPFAPGPMAGSPSVEAPVSQNSTSTFVAAARRAQRAKQEAQPAASTSNSLISKALSRFKPSQPGNEPVEAVPAEVKAPKPAKLAKAPKPEKAPKVEAPAMLDGDEPVQTESFLTRHRRPLLLAATLVAVSMLALNLVMARMGPARTATPPAPAAETVEEAPAPEPVSMNAEPTATDDSAALVSPQPRVIEMVDSSATGSINPGAPMSFSAPTPMPAALSGTPAAAAITPLDAPAAETAGVDAAPATFELPPEAVGPLELRDAASKGDARAQFEIGAIYSEGHAVPQDYAAAATWYERAAAQGFVPAQYRLGSLYEAGNGVDKDIEVAKLWYQRGAEAGNRMAMHNLAALYAGGELGEQEFETAAQWFEQAAKLGMTDSQFNLGMLYARGLGVEQDLEQSYTWFSLAARSGDEDAAKARDDIARSLSADAVQRLDDGIGLWKAEPIVLGSNFAPIGTWAPSFDPGEPIGTQTVVAKVQEALTRLGYDVGTPDGLAGPKTAEAIKAFERGTGMTESGAINPRLLAVLGSQPV